MLPFFLAVAFSAVPLTLYLPPMRHFTLFMASIQELFMETGGYRRRFCPRLRFSPSRIVRLLLAPASISR